MMPPSPPSPPARPDRSNDPDRDGFLACSDLCEENRFPRQAGLLRAMAGAGGRVFVLAEAAFDHDGRRAYLDGEGDGHPVAFYFDRAEARRAADSRNARWLRAQDLRRFGDDLAGFTSLPTRGELNRRVAALLKAEPDLWPENGPIGGFPASATHAQMIEVSRLFDRLRPFRVIEAEFGG